jgi:epoxyqueuosine reductase
VKQEMLAEIEALKISGLNLFSSLDLSQIPTDMLNAFKEMNIPYEDYQFLVMIGHGGNDLWDNLPDHFKELPHPLDSFVLKKIEEFHNQLGITSSPFILYPHETLILPLQRLGRLVHMSHESPVGIDINPEYGLWFAFRGVFLTKGPLGEIKLSETTSPCLSCLERPCLDHSNFWGKRLACPYQRKHQYKPEQIKYHQSLVMK